jgi:hypothetical protein
LITKTFPRRRTTTDPGLRFSDLIELRTFTADSFRPEALKLDIALNTISITIIPAVPGVAAGRPGGGFLSGLPAGTPGRATGRGRGARPVPDHGAGG